MNLNSLDYMIMNPGMFGMGFNVNHIDVWILALDSVPDQYTHGVWEDDKVWTDANLWLD